MKDLRIARRAFDGSGNVRTNPGRLLVAVQFLAINGHLLTLQKVPNASLQNPKKAQQYFLEFKRSAVEISQEEGFQVQ